MKPASRDIDGIAGPNRKRLFVIEHLDGVARQDVPNVFRRGVMVPGMALPRQAHELPKRAPRSGDVPGTHEPFDGSPLERLSRHDIRINFVHHPSSRPPPPHLVPDRGPARLRQLPIGCGFLCGMDLHRMSFVERHASPGPSSPAKRAEEPGALREAAHPRPDRRCTISWQGIPEVTYGMNETEGARGGRKMWIR